jgi:transposase
MSKSNPNSLRSLEILQNIKSGSTDPASLSPAQRKLIVMLLMAEGQSTAEIAHLLKVSDRTIERDKQAVRKENALVQDPEYAGVMAGRLVDEAQVCIQRMRKFQRDPNCPPATKIEAEKNSFQILNSLAERLQSLGFLPTAFCRRLLRSWKPI